MYNSFCKLNKHCDVANGCLQPNLTTLKTTHYSTELSITPYIASWQGWLDGPASFWANSPHRLWHQEVDTEGGRWTPMPHWESITVYCLLWDHDDHYFLGSGDGSPLYRADERPSQAPCPDGGLPDGTPAEVRPPALGLALGLADIPYIHLNISATPMVCRYPGYRLNISPFSIYRPPLARTASCL